MQTPSIEDSPAPSESFPRSGIALLLYAALALLLTWPLVIHLTDHVPGGNNDLWQNYWNFWWWKTALLEQGKLPYSTDLVYQPGGAVSLAFQTHSPANILLTFPVLLVAGIPAAMNSAVLLGFVFAGWGAYLLCRELIEDRRAAFLGGVVFAFFPQHFEQSLEHLNLASIEAMPFFLYFLVKLVRRGGWHNTVLCAAFFALNALFSWHNLLLILPFGIVLFIWELLRAERPRLGILGEATFSGAVACVLLLPFAYPMVAEILQGETYFLKPPPPLPKGIDPLFLLLPAEYHPLWGNLVTGIYQRLRGYGSVGFTCYLGVTALALWIAGRCRPGSREVASTAHRLSWALWTCIFLFYLLLALGDPLVLAGTRTSLKLPFAALENLPLVGTLRVANRFVVPATLALSVLAAYGALQIFSMLRPGSWLDRRKVLWGLLALLAVDYVWIPYPLRTLPQPQWTEQLEKAPPGLLLNIPGGHRARGADDLYLQTLHGRPLVGGYTSCIPPHMEKRVEELPYLQLIFEGRPRVETPVASGLEEVLRTLPVTVVVVHLGRERERLAALREPHLGTWKARLYNPEKGTPRRIIDETRVALRDLWGNPMYADDEVEIYTRSLE
jgi:hypothetical protein